MTVRQLLNIFRQSASSRQGASGQILVVSGLPRSGTSLMMRMLEAGGIPVLTDRLREADIDNPAGYYEFERAKQLEQGDHGWLEQAQGHAVKIISALLKHLPPAYEYKVIFMHRNMAEILASQKKMLLHRGEAVDSINDGELAAYFEQHKQQILAWLQTQENMAVLDVDYNQLISEPDQCLPLINHFFEGMLVEEEMAKMIDDRLYRNRVS